MQALREEGVERCAAGANDDDEAEAAEADK